MGRQTPRTAVGLWGLPAQASGGVPIGAGAAAARAHLKPYMSHYTTAYSQPIHFPDTHTNVKP